MRITTSILLLTGCLIVGCAGKPKPPAAAPAPSVEQFQSIKTAIKEINPTARVGVVTAVLESESLAMIGDVDVTGLRPGDVFTIVDAAQAVVAHASIVDILDGKLAVRFDAGARIPAVGDVAVKF